MSLSEKMETVGQEAFEYAPEVAKLENFIKAIHARCVVALSNQSRERMTRNLRGMRDESKALLEELEK